MASRPSPHLMAQQQRPPYNIDILDALDVETAHDPDQLHFSPPLETTAYEQSLDALHRYVSEGTINTSPPGQKSFQFIHTPYEGRPAPLKTPKAERKPKNERASSEASRTYRERKKQEMADAYAEIARLKERVSNLERDVAQRDGIIQKLGSERDQFKHLAAAAAAQPVFQAPVSNYRSPPPAATSGLRADAMVLSPRDYAEAPPAELLGVSTKNQEQLRKVFYNLRDLLERPTSSDEEIGQGLAALGAMFFTRNYITPDQYDTILTPDYLLRTYFLFPDEEDVREDTAEERHEEIMLWSQVFEKAGLSQEQFEKYVVTRQRFRTSMKRLLRERMELHKGLKAFFFKKVAYLRFLTLSEAAASAENVATTSQLITRLRGNLQSMIQLRKWLVVTLESFMTVRQHATINLYVRQPTMHTYTAISAVTELNMQGQ